MKSNHMRKRSARDKNVKLLLSLGENKPSMKNVIQTMQVKNEEALQMHNRIQYLKNQEQRKLKRLQESWKVA